MLLQPRPWLLSRRALALAVAATISSVVAQADPAATFMTVPDVSFWRPSAQIPNEVRLQVSNLLAPLLADPGTYVVSYPNDALCVFNIAKPEALAGIGNLLPELQASNGCSSIGGVAIVGYTVLPVEPGQPEVGGGGESNAPDPASGSPGQSSFWALVSQAEVDKYAAAFTEARTVQWSAENSARQSANSAAERLADARFNLAQFWSSQSIIDHNKAAIRQQRTASGVLFYVVLVLVGLGIVMTVVQFIIAMRTSGQMKDELPEVKSALEAVAAAGAAQPGADHAGNVRLNALPAAMQLAETELKLEMGKIGMTVKTSIIGVVVLIASFGFLFLYLRYVFPLSFPSVPAIEASAEE